MYVDLHEAAWAEMSEGKEEKAARELAAVSLTET